MRLVWREFGESRRDVYRNAAAFFAKSAPLSLDRRYIIIMIRIARGRGRDPPGSPLSRASLMRNRWERREIALCALFEIIQTKEPRYTGGTCF